MIRQGLVSQAEQCLLDMRLWGKEVDHVGPMHDCVRVSGCV